MIYFFTPYSFEKKLFKAYDDYMKLIPNPEDWGCIMDGDMAFLLSDFGHQIQEYINKYPVTGMFSCYANRNPYGHQMRPGLNPESDSVRYIFQNAVEMYEKNHGKVTPCQRRIAGFLMVIKKATWLKYREEIAAHAQNANIQAVDTAISDILVKHDEKILLMEGMQVFHYFRQYSRSEKHILSDKLTVVIRTHDRPQMFKRAIESVLCQTHKNIDIVVGADTPGSLEYASAYNPTRLIKLEGRKRTSHSDFPPNEYVSELIKDIHDGYILILDDDNYIADPRGVEKLFKHIDKEWCIYIIRYRYPDGRLFPNNQLFNSKQIQNGGVDWASCVFHARFNKVSKSLPLYNADYHFIRNLVNYAKTTKFIDLALVHTETPGNDGKTEAELMGDTRRTHDVVYVLGRGSLWANNEIRYSIRSFEKYFENLRNVVVVGELPQFMHGVVHIPCNDKPGVNKDARMALKLTAACLDARVSENFIFCCDDMLLLAPLTADDFCGWHDGPIKYNAIADRAEHKRVTDSTVPPSDWFTFVYNTGNELKKRGLPDNNYDRAHAPQPINKKEFLQVLEQWDMERNRYTISNIYLNSSQIFKGKHTVLNAKIYQAIGGDDILQFTDGKQCLNYNDEALNEALKQWLMTNFSEPSKYEIFEAANDRRHEAEQWFKRGCNYEEGIEIFRRFAPRNRMLLRYFEMKRNNELADKKLKNTLQLWLR